MGFDPGIPRPKISDAQDATGPLAAARVSRSKVRQQHSSAYDGHEDWQHQAGQAQGLPSRALSPPAVSQRPGSGKVAVERQLSEGDKQLRRLRHLIAASHQLLFDSPASTKYERAVLNDRLAVSTRNNSAALVLAGSLSLRSECGPKSSLIPKRTPIVHPGHSVQKSQASTEPEPEPEPEKHIELQPQQKEQAPLQSVGVLPQRNPHGKDPLSAAGHSILRGAEKVQLGQLLHDIREVQSKLGLKQVTRQFPLLDDMRESLIPPALPLGSPGTLDELRRAKMQAAREVQKLAQLSEATAKRTQLVQEVDLLRSKVAFLEENRVHSALPDRCL